MKRIFIFIHSLPALAAFLLLSGCIRDVVIELPDHEPQVVANSTIMPDSLFEAHVSLSAPILEPGGPQSVTNATVLVLHNGTVIDSLIHLGEGNYGGTATPAENQNYTLRVSVPGHSTVEGTAFIPQRVQITGGSFEDSTLVDPFGFVVGSATLAFTDPAATADFYQVSLFTLERFIYLTDTFLFWNPIQIYTDDPLLNDGIFWQEGILITDELFNGEAREFKVSFDSGYFTDSIPVYAVLGTLSEDYYKYTRSVSTYQDNSFNPFAEPVIFHTNMSNGFGIFAGSVADTLRVR